MEYRVKGPPAWAPTHPGALLREDVLPALQLSVKEAAEKLGVSRQTLHTILGEKGAVTPEMAARLGKLCGNGPELWLQMQVARDLWFVARDLAAEIERIPTLKKPARPMNGSPAGRPASTRAKAGATPARRNSMHEAA